VSKPSELVEAAEELWEETMRMIQSAEISIDSKEIIV